MHDRPEEMRTKAEEVRKTAATVADASLKSQMILIALQYEEDADRSESLVGRAPPPAAGGDRQPH